MTDRQVGLFIGDTLQLNVICSLTIKLQLGVRKGVSRGGKTVFTWISKWLQPFLFRKNDPREKVQKYPLKAGEHFEVWWGWECRGMEEN